MRRRSLNRSRPNAPDAVRQLDNSGWFAANIDRTVLICGARPNKALAALWPTQAQSSCCLGSSTGSPHSSRASDLRNNLLPSASENTALLPSNDRAGTMARIGAPYRVLQTSHALVAESGELGLGLGLEAAGPLQAPAAVPVEKNRQKGARWEPQRQV